MSGVAKPHHVAIVGAGFGGLGMAMRLERAGFGDFVVLERAGDVGGTWRDNTYPGCACDVPSHLYSLSFALKGDWSRSFAEQPEIQQYLRQVARDSGVMDRVRLDHELLAARWDGEDRLWRLETSRGSFAARVLVMATGPLSEPATPTLPGLESFRGTAFHSARWRHEHDLAGRGVAVIGTGASAIQIVPRIQPVVKRLHLFQRTPPWVIPRLDRRFSRAERWAMRHVPGLERIARACIYWGREAYVLGFAFDRRILKLAERLALGQLSRQVKDPTLRATLTPRYDMGCKRIVLASDYYPALQQENVSLVTAPIREITRDAVVTSDGVAHAVDTIVLATGFQVTEPPIARRITGEDGRTLSEVWRDGMSAYLGTTVAGFPNAFVLLGPNTGLGHTSVVFMTECQIAYTLDALRHMESRGLAVARVRPDAQDAYNTWLERRMARTVWARGGCVSWYMDRSGKNTTLWPTFTWLYRRRTRRFDPDAYDLEER